MAHLYPESIFNSKSNGETKIFKIFKTFSDDFHIIHSLPWLSLLTAKETNRYTPEGEIDFVILHKDYGVLCVEIKGGRISYRKNAYFTNDNNKIKNPYDQVRDSLHYLRKIVDNILIGYSVGFPDSEKPKLIDDHPLITFDMSDLKNLQNKIINIFEYWQKSIKKKRPKESDITLLLKRLLPKSKDELHQKIIYDNKEWLTPSEEQSNIITNVLKSDRFYVTGRAGTGKTILSIIIVRELLGLDLKILFLTFNKIINEYIQKQFDNDNIDIYTFHKFLLENNTLKRDVICDTDLILDNIVENITNEYSVLIIDEAQSFSQTWLNSLSKYFKNKKVYIFADSLQSFSNEGKVTDQAMNAIFHFDNQLTLTKNYRSPRKVYERLLEIFSSSIQQISPRNIDELDLVEEISSEPSSMMKHKIDELLNKGISDMDIVVLISSLEKENKEGYAYRDICVETVNRYRGMEKSIIIYMLTRADKIGLEELYIAYSRSTTQTIVIIPDTIVTIMKSKLKEMLLNSDFTDKKLKNEINKKESDFKEKLIFDYPNEFLKNIIFYSNKYFLFFNTKYKFINTLVQDYLNNQEIPYLEISQYHYTKAILYTSLGENFSVEFELCENCGNKRFIWNKFCIQCTDDKFKVINLEKLIEDKKIMLKPKKYTFEEQNKLHDSLKSIGRIFWKFNKVNQRLTTNTLELLNHKDVMCISFTLEVLIMLIDYKDNSILLKDIREHCSTRRFNGLRDDNLVARSGVYIGRFITHGLFEKIDNSTNGKKYKIYRDKIFQT